MSKDKSLETANRTLINEAYKPIAKDNKELLGKLHGNPLVIKTIDHNGSVVEKTYTDSYDYLKGKKKSRKSYRRTR